MKIKKTPKKLKKCIRTKLPCGETLTAERRHLSGPWIITKRILGTPIPDLIFEIYYSLGAEGNLKAIRDFLAEIDENTPKRYKGVRRQ